VDAIVLSVGTGFGRLADAVRRRYPQVQWEYIDVAAVRPDAPTLIELPQRTSTAGSPRWAVLASLHPEPQRPPTRDEALAAIPVAVRAALDVAVRAGARSVLVPIMGTGALHLPTEAATEAVLTAAVGAAASSSAVPSSVVFLASDPAATSVIQGRWAAISPDADAGAGGRRTSLPAGSSAPDPSASDDREAPAPAPEDPVSSPRPAPDQP